MGWSFTFPSGRVMQGWDWAVLSHQTFANRVIAWKARWDGQMPGVMPLQTDPSAEERLRADCFIKKKDGTQRMGTTKCFSCRTSGAPVHPPPMTQAEDRLYCGCLYEQAFLQAYLVRRGLLGPNIQGVPNTLSKETCNMIMLLLKDQFGPNFDCEDLLVAYDRSTLLQDSIMDNQIEDLVV